MRVLAIKVICEDENAKVVTWYWRAVISPGPELLGRVEGNMKKRTRKPAGQWKAVHGTTLQLVAYRPKHQLTLRYPAPLLSSP